MSLLANFHDSYDSFSYIYFQNLFFSKRAQTWKRKNILKNLKMKWTNVYDSEEEIDVTLPEMTIKRGSLRFKGIS